MNKIDELLEFLARSGSSYRLDEVSRLVGIPYDNCEKIVQFLARHNFVHIDDSEVKINPKIRVFIIATSDETLSQLPPRLHTTTGI